ncbi:MAG: hypothetical protein ACYSU7_16555 [Planctomycetota bacterium]|jgi:hypothetical protein
MTVILNAVTTMALAGAPSEPAAPGPESPRPPRPESSLQVTLLPGVWLPRLGGDVNQGPGGTDISLDKQLGLDDQEATINVELTVRKQEVWSLTFTGFHYDTGKNTAFDGSGTFGGISLSDGDPIRSDFELTSVSGEFAYALWRPYADGSTRAGAGPDNRTPDGHYICDLRIAPLFGMRYLDVDQSLASGGSTVVTGGEWLAVYGGLEVTLDYRPEDAIPLMRMFRMQASLAVGPALGGDDGSMWQVRGGITIQVTENVGVMVGYRLVELDVENDDYQLDGGLQGLFLAGSIRF